MSGAEGIPENLRRDRVARLGVLLGYHQSPEEMRDSACAAEQAGFDSVWVTEATWDIIVPLALIATATGRVRLGTACAIVGRHPYFAQMAAAGLDEVSRGRFMFGLAAGPSGANASWPGAPPANAVRRMREYVELLRAMLGSHARGNVEFAGEYYELSGFRRGRPAYSERLPILIGTTGPRMLELAGEIADGFVGAALVSRKFVDQIVVPHVSAGLEAAGRSWDEFELTAVRICAVSDDGARARSDARKTVAFYVAIAPALAAVLDLDGLATERRLIEDAVARGAIDEAAALLSDEALELFAIAGTPDECRAQCREFGRAVDTTILFPPWFGVSDAESAAYHRAIVETWAAEAPRAERSP